VHIRMAQVRSRWDWRKRGESWLLSKSMDNLMEVARRRALGARIAHAAAHAGADHRAPNAGGPMWMCVGDRSGNRPTPRCETVCTMSSDNQG
jgi:hypothetical protein